MLCKNNLLEEKIKGIVLEEVENERNFYHWTSEYEDINFWEFVSINYLQLDRFFLLLDVESGPNSGWEKCAELLGMTLWEDRKWCHQYHNGVGPMKAALLKLIERKTIDKDLSLSTVMEYIKEMDRYDILLSIDWKPLADRFRCLKKSGIEKITCESLTLQLHTETNCDQLLNAENVKDANRDLVDCKSLKGKRSKRIESEPIILMSYAPDAEKFAEKVAKQLKREGSGKKIWVIMIGDATVKDKLALDTYNVLHKWVNQVWFVVPVLSPQYLQQVQNQDPSADKFGVAKYNKLIYSFTTQKFCSNGARNFHCRPICSKEHFLQVQRSIIVKGNGLLSVIWCFSNPEEIEEFRKVVMDKPLQ